MIGKVIEVFIPDNNFNMIGFKVRLEDEILEVVKKQDISSCNIYREDNVSVFYQDNNIDIIKILDEQ